MGWREEGGEKERHTDPSFVSPMHPDEGALDQESTLPPFGVQADALTTEKHLLELRWLIYSFVYK